MKQIAITRSGKAIYNPGDITKDDKLWEYTTYISEYTMLDHRDAEIAHSVLADAYWHRRKQHYAVIAAYHKKRQLPA